MIEKWKKVTPPHFESIIFIRTFYERKIVTFYLENDAKKREIIRLQNPDLQNSILKRPIVQGSLASLPF